MACLPVDSHEQATNSETMEDVTLAHLHRLEASMELRMQEEVRRVQQSLDIELADLRQCLEATRHEQQLVARQATVAENKHLEAEFADIREAVTEVNAALQLVLEVRANFDPTENARVDAEELRRLRVDVEELKGLSVVPRKYSEDSADTLCPSISEFSSKTIFPGEAEVSQEFQDIQDILSDRVVGSRRLDLFEEVAQLRGDLKLERERVDRTVEMFEAVMPSRVQELSCVFGGNHGLEASVSRFAEIEADSVSVSAMRARLQAVEQQLRERQCESGCTTPASVTTASPTSQPDADSEAGNVRSLLAEQAKMRCELSNLKRRMSQLAEITESLGEKSDCGENVTGELRVLRAELTTLKSRWQEPHHQAAAVGTVASDVDEESTSRTVDAGMNMWTTGENQNHEAVGQASAGFFETDKLLAEVQRQLSELPKHRFHEDHGSSVTDTDADSGLEVSLRTNEFFLEDRPTFRLGEDLFTGQDALADFVKDDTFFGVDKEEVTENSEDGILMLGEVELDDVELRHAASVSQGDNIALCHAASISVEPKIDRASELTPCGQTQWLRPAGALKLGGPADFFGAISDIRRKICDMKDTSSDDGAPRPRAPQEPAPVQQPSQQRPQQPLQQSPQHQLSLSKHQVWWERHCSDKMKIEPPRCCKPSFDERAMAVASSQAADLSCRKTLFRLSGEIDQALSQAQAAAEKSAARIALCSEKL
eukprot:CAMPEP_0194481894 /NCGR_PEP_ID=MMETSP0253-20130528/4101_1 /TAXON_ID=2966 /ORGANISM="Noctiluca scintillans" /LENGTH=711 /DNA_ID=CAMNT_0039321403 /DNA_START=31 /DNA_END=2166 /DNA_ORIENTATION=+